MANLMKTHFLVLSDDEAEKASPSLFTNLLYTNYDPTMENLINQYNDSFFMNQTKAGAGTSSRNQQNSSRSSSSIPVSPTIVKARKREIDRAYRAKQKHEKTQMKSNLESLVDENHKLKTEIGSLKQDNIQMNEILKSQAKEIDPVKTELEKLNYEYNKQSALVQRLSELLAFPDLQLENQRLKYEIAQLRHNASLDPRISQYAEENARLKLENRALNVQKDALCGKIINDNYHKW